MIILAGKSDRFINFVVDTFCFIIIVMAHVFFLNALLRDMLVRHASLFQIYFALLYFGYYFLFEYFTGRTPGKLISGTEVTDTTGEKAKIDKLLIRNICRFIPFENFSFLFSNNGWHDRISDTQVVYYDKSKHTVLKRG